MKKRFIEFFAKIKQKRIEKKQKRLEKIIKIVLGLTLSLSVILSLFVFPSSAETEAVEMQFPIVPSGTYTFDSVPYADGFKYLTNDYYIFSSSEDIIIKYNYQGVEYIFKPFSVQLYYIEIYDYVNGVVSGYENRLQFENSDGEVIQIYTFDIIGNVRDALPDSISEANWYIVAMDDDIGSNPGPNYYMRYLDSFDVVTNFDVTTQFLTDIFLVFSNYDYYLSGVVTVNNFYSIDNFSMNDVLVDCNIRYRGGIYSGPFEFTFPYYTSSGGVLRVYAYSAYANTRLYLDNSYGFGIEFDQISIKSIPDLYYCFHFWDVSYGEELSYFVRGDFYSKVMVVPQNLYAKVSFTSNGENFNYISSGVYDYGNGEIERYIRYDEIQVFTEHLDADGTVIESFWRDLDYKHVNFGESFQLINYATYEFINANYALIDSDDALQSAFESGYISGYQAGYSVGMEDGTSVGYENGYNKGYSDGEDVGYNTGYDEGYAQGSSLTSGDEFFSNFMGGIVNALDSLTLFGSFSIYDLIVTILGAFVLLFILRLIAGG